MKAVAVSLGIVALLPLAGCRKRSAIEGDDFSDSGPKPPAATAKEWNERLDGKKSMFGREISDLYAELPPLQEWPAVIEHLRNPGAGAQDPKFRFLAELLAEDEASNGASDTFRALVMSRNKASSEYQRDKVMRYLYMFSEDPVEAKQWAEKHLPAPDEKTGPAHQEEIAEVAELLKKNQINQAFEVLWKDVEKEKEHDDRLDALGKIATLGRLLDKPDQAEKAITAMTELSLKLPAEDVFGTYILSPLLDELVQRKEWQTIRKIGNRFRSSSQFSKEDFHALSLIATYHLEGPKAFIKGLEESPTYGVNETAAYAEFLNSEVSTNGPKLGEFVVRAWQAEGKRDLAWQTLQSLIVMNGGADPFYRLATDLFPHAAPEFLRSLLTYNPYEERPLIWLAELELRAGRPAEAHKLIDQAIALDPSDGEQGKDSRMQAYDVLSRILKAEGNNEKAEFFAKVTKSIRQGEAADDYLNAGLVDEAVRRYQQALGEFGDAYCLQSRLALTLMKAGRFEEAKVHFEKAFELMPVSFGPVESHCFGCEGIFQDDRVQTIALNVFRKVIDKQPDNPRVHYLVGMLLEKMKNPREAANSYRRALELDPKYYNCAIHLHQLLLSDFATVREANAFYPQLVKITPYPDLASRFQNRTDLKQTWIDAQTPPPSPLKLTPLSLPFTPVAKKDDMDIHVSSYVRKEIGALDGWSTDELLRDNSLADWIDNGW